MKIVNFTSTVDLPPLQAWEFYLRNGCKPSLVGADGRLTHYRVLVDYNNNVLKIWDFVDRCWILPTNDWIG